LALRRGERETMSGGVLSDLVVERHDAALARGPSRVFSDLSAERAQAQRLSLAARVRLKRARRAPAQRVEPSYDTLLCGAESEERRSVGVLLDLLTERELYDPEPYGQPAERDALGQLPMPCFGTAEQRLTNRALATVHVHSQHQWDARVGAPHQNSLLDERMGPIRKSDLSGNTVHCAVCDGVLHNDHYCAPRAHEPGLCAGHFGVIVLPGAVWHPMGVAVVRAALETLCWHCGGLPSTPERCAAIVRQMRAQCATRVDRLRYLARCFKTRRSCLACAARHRCGARAPQSGALLCGPGTEQCAECRTLVHFRPALRTDKQLQNRTRSLQRAVAERHDGELGADAEAREPLYAAANRGHRTSGFPCEALLDGHVRSERAAERAAYERFAALRYGALGGVNRLVMHGERVRAVLQQATPQFLDLLRDDELESGEEVRDWLLALVPRVLPVPPNCVRPTEIKTEMVGRDGVAHIQLHDLTKRYQQIVRCVDKMSRAIDAAECYERATPLSGPVATLYADLHRSPRDAWHQYSLGDFRFVDLYGLVQYYYAAIVSSKLAPKFLPTRARRRGVGSSAASSAARQSAAKAAPDAGSGSGGGVSKSFADIMHGKQGRVRENLMGKRVDQTARSVIVPDHNVGVHEVLLPAEIAARLSVPERVCALNARELVTRAERIRTLDVARRSHQNCLGCAQCEALAVNERSDLCVFTAARDERVRYNDSALAQPIAEHPFVHEAGAIIERPLRTGDLVVMNRQPTLHRQSMMAHRVRLLEPVGADGGASRGAKVNAIRLHELVTDPYNADFDGDEMNVHRPQGAAAEAEMRTLMTVAQNLISSRNSAPCLGLKQDAATGMYLLTSRDTFLEHHQVCQVLLFAVREHGLRLPQPAVRVWQPARGRWRVLWTGAQVASFALPGRVQGASADSDSLLQYRRPARFELDARRLDYPAGGVNNETVLPFVVIDSEIVCGRVEKSVAGKKHGAMHHAIAMRAGVPSERAFTEACDFVNRCSWIASAFLTLRGFSVGLQDCMFGAHQRDAARQIKRITRSVHERVDALLAGRSAESRALLLTDHYADRVAEVERRISAIADNGFDRAARLVGRCVAANNALLVMRVSGGKGQPLNACQVKACVGQQRIGGQRVINTHVSVKSDGDAKTAGGSRAEGGRENTTGGGGAGAGAKTRNKTAPGGRSRLDGDARLRVLDFPMHRFSPHTVRGVYPNAAAGGFIDRSFIDGLTPSQFFQHAQGGREGLIDTAIKTAQTGYLQRKAMKSCEALAVRYDGTVRDATNQIVSMRFGDNAVDPRALMRKTLRFIGMGRAQLGAALFYDESDARDEWCAAHSAGAALGAVLVRERDALHGALHFLRGAAARVGGECTLATPNNLETIVADVVRETQRSASGSAASRQRSFCGQERWHEDDARVRDAALRHSVGATFAEPSEAQRARCRAAPHLEPLHNAVEAAQVLERRLERWRDTLRVLDHLTECELRLRLASKQVLRRYELSRTELERVLDLYEDVLQRAQVQPGESVGAEMVQAIGEPATQMTLVRRAAARARARSLARSPAEHISPRRRGRRRCGGRHAAHARGERGVAARFDERHQSERTAARHALFAARAAHARRDALDALAVARAALRALWRARGEHERHAERCARGDAAARASGACAERRERAALRHARRGARERGAERRRACAARRASARRHRRAL